MDEYEDSDEEEKEDRRRSSRRSRALLPTPIQMASSRMMRRARE